MLLVEHDISLVMAVCHQIHVLNLGKIIAYGHRTRDPAAIRR